MFLYLISITIKLISVVKLDSELRSISKHTPVDTMHKTIHS